jgi:uncharacterized protein YlxW (UPF0749 family)
MNRRENFPAPEEPAAPTAAAFDTPSTRKRGGGALFSLTSIFFVFGILLAFGMRSIEAVRKNELEKKQTLALEQKQLEVMQRTLAREEKERVALQKQIADYEKQVKENGTASKAQTAKFNAEIKKLQVLVGMTPVKGEGITIRLSDNPEASANAGPNAGPFLPGIVHDFDLLQVVNELRAAKAEAIAINGVRVTGYTPIRCVGPTIYVNFVPKPAPFVIEAIGDSAELKSAVSMPGGIVENLREQATLGVKVTEHDNLTLPAAEGLPPLRAVKPM